MQVEYGFLTQLVAGKVGEAPSFGRARWRLHTDLAFFSPSYGLIVAPTGFIFDGASVPRLPLVFWLFGDTAHASSGIHDYCLDVLVPQGLMTWQQAEEVFGEAMEYEGVPAWRRLLMKFGAGGDHSAPANTWEEHA